MSATKALSRYTLPIVLFLLSVVVTVWPTPASTKAAAAAPAQGKRIGLVFDVGGRGDKSFNDAAYEGLLRAEKELGVRITYLEPTGSEDREAALRLFASLGYDLVIGVGFIFSSDVDVVAREYPKVPFACIDYFPGPSGMPPNVAALSFREEEGSYLVGAVAGQLTKSKHVGFVGGMTGPLIKKFETGYRVGVKSVCPACEVHVGYAGATPDAYRDPAKGKSITVSQIALGADVVYHASGATGHGVFEAAREGHALAIGVDSDQHDEMPGVVVTSMVKRADVAVFNIIRGIHEGAFVPGMHVFGLKEDGVDYVHEGPHAANLPPAVIAKTAQLKADVVSGKVTVPKE
ncbi:MAG: BMP family ABC transporter substrate-binding protein [Polyangiaceae bacterium]